MRWWDGQSWGPEAPPAQSPTQPATKRRGSDLTPVLLLAFGLLGLFLAIGNSAWGIGAALLGLASVASAICGVIFLIEDTVRRRRSRRQTKRL